MVSVRESKTKENQVKSDAKKYLKSVCIFMMILNISASIWESFDDFPVLKRVGQVCTVNG